METQSTYAQRELDKISKILHEELIELHFIYCPCERCEAWREFERVRREGK